MPGPRLSRNFAIVEDSSIGAINWICARADRGAAHRQHCFANSLVLVDFLVHQDHAEVVVIPGDGRVEVGDCDADVIDRRHQRGGQQLTGVNLIGRHHITVT